MKFREVQGLADGEHLLERKTLNRHSAIYTLALPQSRFREPSEIRKRVKQLTRPFFLRGLGFGVHLVADELPENADAFWQAIDGVQNGVGVWQWTILQLEKPKFVFGLHTWMRVMLSDSYDQRIGELINEGYSVERLTLEPGKLFKLASIYDQYEHYRPPG